MGALAIAKRSLSVSTPARQNISVGGCMPTVLVALLARHTGAVGDVGVARAVDHHLCENGRTAAFALRDDAANGVAIHDRAGKECVEQHIDARFCQHLQGHGLHRLRLDKRDAHMQRARAMFARAVALGSQPFDEFFRQAIDDLVALLAEKAQHRQANRHVAANEAAAFDQANTQIRLPRRRAQQ